jgi:HEAT repeat protein
VTGVLAATTGALGAIVVLLLLLIVAMRLILTRRRRRMGTLRPSAEASIAGYLAGGAPVAAGGTRRERAVLLAVSLDALSDVRGSDRARLVALLDELGYTEELIRGLGARRRVDRRRAADMLATIGTESAAPALAIGAHDRDILVRTACAAALACVGGADDVPAIIAAAERDADAAPGAATAIVFELATHRPAALAPLLAPGAAPPVRAIAAAVASELRLPEYSERLRSCLASDDLAATAARGLGLIGEIAALPALLELAKGNGRPPRARVAATVALGRIGAVSALPALVTLLGDRDWSLSAAAAEALHSLGDPGDAALRQAAGASSGQLRELAEAALQP